jgi:hypothetical protein
MPTPRKPNFLALFEASALRFCAQPSKKPADAGFFHFKGTKKATLEVGQQTERRSLAIIEGFVWHLDFERSQRPR